MPDKLSPGLFPMIVFLLAAATAFATGTSWGTMGILMPLVVPLSFQVVGGVDPETVFDPIVLSSISCVLAGAVWGDHCSPISDTTVLSSLASGCDHVDHVRTQLPYALIVGIVAIGVGTVPCGYGIPWWASMPMGLIVLFLALKLIGRRCEDGPEPA